MKITGNSYGVIKLFKASMILRLLLTYWGRRVCILKVVKLLNKKLIQLDTKNFRTTNRLRRVFFVIILKRLEHPSQVCRISHLLPLNPPSIGVPKVPLHQMTLIHLQYQDSLLHQTYYLRVPQEVFQMVHLFLVYMAILKN